MKEGFIVKENEIKSTKINNGYGLTGFVLGICSFLFGGMFALLAIIFSSISIGKFDTKINKNKWQGVTGLILGILYTIVSLLWQYL